MRLDRLDAATAHALLAGDLGGRETAPGWPHEDTAPGLLFVDHGGEAFLVIDDDGRIAGECGTKSPPDAEGMVEIGYGLGTGSRGRGLGTAAVAALVAWLRAVPAVRRIEAEVHAYNVPSQRVVERQGLVRVHDSAVGYLRYRLDVTD
ncbi:MAG TPA: GNAT family N-acetyltransferase [Mycobacteriales bacterium]|jgi:RimJ/RimL family protein N-acetyltransferase|nr:GNAT family N-acetyltransferase [Mycobacteriales bacterium]